MKQLLVLSGKGGTGKTTVSGAFLAMQPRLFAADCDVDAPNLHLLWTPEKSPETKLFYGMDKAVIKEDLCTSCGICAEACRFGAIAPSGEGKYQVDPVACEGCGLCLALCPAQGVEMTAAQAGTQELFWGQENRFSTARLKMGSGNTGLLVTQVKKALMDPPSAGFLGDEEDRKSLEKPMPNLAVIDGSPGIGCPVIASMSGVDLVLIVTEPSLSGISDLERILKTAATFRTPAAVCINKADIHPDNANRIRELCRDRKIPFVGEIPYDPMAIRAVNHRESLIYEDCPAGNALRAVYDNTMKLMTL